MIDIGFSKKDRKEILERLIILEEIIKKLKRGNPKEFEEIFPSLHEFISLLLPNEEKAVLQARKEVTKHKNIAKSSSRDIVELRESLKKLEEELRCAIETANENNSIVNDRIVEINNSKEQISEIENQIKNQTESIDANIRDTDTLLKDVDPLKDKIKSIEEMIEKNDDLIKKLSLIRSKATKSYSKIKTIYNEIFGYTEINAEGERVNHIEGLKDDLEKSYDNLKFKLDDYNNKIDAFKQEKEDEYLKLKEKWDKEFETTNNKIKALLPSALTAGLSSAYQKKKENEEEERDKALLSFSRAIYALTAISLIPFAVCIYLYFGLDKKILELIKTIPNIVTSILPLYIPALWVAYSSDKKSKLSKRLIEEYSHKEALSKTFEGLSNQVKEIGKGSITNNLEVKLLHNLIEVSSENPGKLISDYNKSDHPILDAIEKSWELSKSMEKISLIPGIEALFNKVKEKRDKELNQMERGVSENFYSSHKNEMELKHKEKDQNKLN